MRRQYSIITALQVGQRSMERGTAHHSEIMQDVTEEAGDTLRDLLLLLLLSLFRLRVLPCIRVPCDLSILVCAADE